MALRELRSLKNRLETELTAGRTTLEEMEQDMEVQREARAAQEQTGTNSKETGPVKEVSTVKDTTHGQEDLNAFKHIRIIIDSFLDKRILSVWSKARLGLHHLSRLPTHSASHCRSLSFNCRRTTPVHPFRYNSPLAIHVKESN